ncbi:UDP-glucose 4-epimerase [candidate division KSB3 bacterium]|uniref:UDP-glucose 4-epimerase n=1 Tax=candidate division KSB3 bacterium TaxID=2044937 RepID=A0A2G6E866_9BACT|nr:MAG: UDP-glucose 4-epimerase [candidate division KSB3 bacterium]PIE30424.1 MAG: UDP-glucose 4-epimerase [candidate division KSB3 bacterium]
MKCVVTGAAGFLGSHISEKLLNMGAEVIGIDCFIDYYPRVLKERNLTNLRTHPHFTFIEKNLLDLNLKETLQGVEYIFHQAAQAGVRASWGRDFEIYTENNIKATQHLLEACKDLPIKRLTYASSSSVYGDVQEFPMRESMYTQPVSPYGVSKLAAEHLCYLYWKNFKVPTISLRYFTVYGPRQRPDMAFNRFITAMLKGETIHIYGDGEQTRDFTFFEDAVQANISSMTKGTLGGVYNIGGGSRVTVNYVLSVLENISGITPKVSYEGGQKGDVRHTFADTSRARAELHYEPAISIEEGLRREVEWLKNIL